MPLKNLKRLSNVRDGRAVSGKKELVPYNNRFVPPNKHISDTIPNKTRKVNSINLVYY